MHAPGLYLGYTVIERIVKIMKKMKIILHFVSCDTSTFIFSPKMILKQDTHETILKMSMNLNFIYEFYYVDTRVVF